MVAIMTALPRLFCPSRFAEDILARIIATSGRENKQLAVGCRSNVSPSGKLSC
jgi:hypothetical protein